MNNQRFIAKDRYAAVFDAALQEQLEEVNRVNDEYAKMPRGPLIRPMPFRQSYFGDTNVTITEAPPEIDIEAEDDKLTS